MDLNGYDQHTKTKAIIYGPPKVGKTVLAGKLAEAFKLHWIDLENGVKSLLNPAMLDPRYRGNINVISIPDHRLNPVAIDTVREIFKGGLKKICLAHGKVNCPLCAKNAPDAVTEIDITKFGDNDILVLDSMSQLGNSAINKVTIKELMKPNGEDYKFTWEDYRMQGALLEQVASLIQVININVVVISHEIDVDKRENATKMVPLGGTRNFSTLLGKYFDECIYLNIVNKQHRAYSSTTYSANVLTGGRSGVTLDELKGDQLSLLPIFQRNKPAAPAAQAAVNTAAQGAKK